MENASSQTSKISEDCCRTASSYRFWLDIRCKKVYSCLLTFVRDSLFRLKFIWMELDVSRSEKIIWCIFRWQEAPNVCCNLLTLSGLIDFRKFGGNQTIIEGYTINWVCSIHFTFYTGFSVLSVIELTQSASCELIGLISSVTNRDVMEDDWPSVWLVMSRD